MDGEVSKGECYGRMTDWMSFAFIKHFERFYILFFWRERSNGWALTSPTYVWCVNYHVNTFQPIPEWQLPSNKSDSIFRWITLCLFACVCKIPYLKYFPGKLTEFSTWQAITRNANVHSFEALFVLRKSEPVQNIWAMMEKLMPKIPFVRIFKVHENSLRSTLAKRDWIEAFAAAHMSRVMNALDSQTKRSKDLKFIGPKTVKSA